MRRGLILPISLAFVSMTVLWIFSAKATPVTEEINRRNQQIEEIQKQIEEYQRQIESSRSQANTLQNKIAELNAQINSITLTIKSLELSIGQTSDDIQDTENQITDAETKIAKHKEALIEYLKIIYENDQETLTEILLKNEDLSDFFDHLNNIRVNQEKLDSTIESIKELKTQLVERQDQLEEKKTEFERLRNLEALEKRSLDQNKNSVNKILKDTKGQETKYQDLVKKSQKDIEALRAQITYLAQNGVSAEDAIQFGQLAAIRTGIRPAFLIAELEHESGLGRNVGKCNRAGDPPSKSYRVIMKPTRDIQPFLEITAQLGLDPETTAVSCPQAGGWGGAMGPAQFIPSTWMGYRDEVTQLTGHNPANPWNIEDAFVAAAAKLSRAGANSKTRAGEIAASKAYYCGNSKSTKSSCINYANAVQRLATEIEKNL